MTRVDHIVFTAPDLETGRDHIEGLLGARPVPGGRHPDFGTHNALLSLGSRTYLEVIAPDPTLGRPGRGRVFGLDAPGPPGLTTWALGTENIEEVSARAHRANWSTGPIEAGQRTRPDGSSLSWRLSDPWLDRLGGVVPFLIDWGPSSHPAGSLPDAGHLEKLIIEHPDPEKVRQALTALGIGGGGVLSKAPGDQYDAGAHATPGICVDVRSAARPGLIAQIQTPLGMIVLK